MFTKAQKEVDKMSNILYSLAVGNLMYAIVCTQLDIAHVVGVVSRYMSNLGMEHWNAIKWILQYLRGTTTKALCFIGSNSSLSRFVDYDLEGDINTKRSTTGYFFTIGGTTI